MSGKRSHSWFKPETRLNTGRFIERLLEAIDTPVALGLALRLRYGEVRAAVEMTVEPQAYDCPASYLLDAQAVALVSKLESLDTGIDRQAAATQKFIEAEASCHRTNEAFLAPRSSPRSVYNTAGPRALRVLHAMKRKISQILGDVPAIADLDLRFGPGATLGTRGDTSVYKKLCAEPECTFAVVPYLGELFDTLPGWLDDSRPAVHLVGGSELSFVPKNAKTDRPICIEPVLNGMMQKGIGSHVRRRLARWGVDLNDQSINQVLARRAYEDGLSTVDFSSASDTVAYALILEMLPIDWVELLDCCRSPYFRADDQWWNFAKWSSMGNAYTFELETLLFFAMATCCCEELGVRWVTADNLHVYGDDVIIPRGVFDLFSEVASLCGFSVNHEKSFRHGSFFESCGKDWFRGHDVRPFFLKKDLLNLEDLFHAANAVLNFAAQLESLYCTGDPAVGPAARRVHRVHTWVVGSIPQDRRLLVPDGQGDCGLVAPFDVAVPYPAYKTRRKRGWEGFLYDRLTTTPVTKEINGCPLAYAVYFLPFESEGQELARRLRWAVYGSPRLISSAPEPVEPVLNGSSYALRKRNKHRIARGYVPQWEDPSTYWSEASMALVHRRRQPNSRRKRTHRPGRK